MTEENVNQEDNTDTLITEEKPLDVSRGRPDGFPEEFWDADKNTPNLDNMFKSYQTEKKRADGLRAKLSKGEFEGKAPEDYKEYSVELSDELRPLVPEDDPIYDAARQAAKQAGLPKEAFNKFMGPVIAKLAEIKAGTEKEPTPEELSAARQLEIDKLGPTGNRIVSAVGSFISTLEASGSLSKEEAIAARNMANSADNVRVLNKLRMMSGRDQVPVEVPIDEKASREDISTKMAKAMLRGDEAEYNKYAALLAKQNNI